MRFQFLYNRCLRASALSSFLVVHSVQAAETLSPGPEPASASAGVSASGVDPSAGSVPVRGKEPVEDPNLNVEVVGVEDPDAIRNAVLRELGSHMQRVGMPARVSISIDESAQELHVVFQSGNGLPVQRVVPAPPRALDIAELAALLAGNLARDDAGLLLEQLALKAKSEKQSAVLTTKKAPVELVTLREPLTQPLPYRPVNLSVFHPISLLSDSEKDNISLDIGLFYGRIGELSGLGLSASGLVRVDGAAQGALVSGLAYWAGGKSQGLAVAGLVGGGGNTFTGLSSAGLALFQNGDVQGLQAAGLASIAKGQFEGVQAAGLFNYAGGLSGLQGAGAANVANGDIRGAQFAGLANVDTANAEGLQVAGASNLALESFSGLQASGLVNLASQLQGLQLSIVNLGGDVTGAQVGLVNLARKVTGAQIGLVNVAGSVSGASVGLVPYVRDGRVQLSAWFDRFQAVNLGVRLQNGLLYFMPAGSFTPSGDSIATEAGPGKKTYFDIAVYAGLRRAFGPLYADLNGGINSPIVNNSSERPVELRYRGLVGYQLLDKLGIFVGGGVRHRIATSGNAGQEFKPTFSVGLDVL